MKQNYKIKSFSIKKNNNNCNNITNEINTSILNQRDQ